MDKLVKKHGDSLVINFDKEDKKIYGIEVGDLLCDIEFVNKKKQYQDD